MHTHTHTHTHMQRIWTGVGTCVAPSGPPAPTSAGIAGSVLHTSSSEEESDSVVVTLSAGSLAAYLQRAKVCKMRV
eukprot:COSAG03_NODE_1957_length_3301_cov_12.017489_1_plen_76_part_00